MRKKLIAIFAGLISSLILPFLVSSASAEEVVVAGSSELPVVNIVPVASGIVTILSLPVGSVIASVNS